MPVIIYRDHPDEDIDRGRALDIARQETFDKIRRLGSIDNWPTLTLEPRRFYTCECGCMRTTHRMLGTDRAACTTAGCRCTFFRSSWSPARIARAA